ncbi:MAG: hypothetical protein ACFFBP_08445 [Promethearchaeota archaeon]
MSDDIDDFVNKVRRFFNIDTDKFDMDVFVLPEPFKEHLDYNDPKKAFKVSYHYEKGMDKPEIKIDSNIDEKKLHEYLKKYNYMNKAGINGPIPSNLNSEINAEDLMLGDYKIVTPLEINEPYTEINDFDDFTEIILEIPGVKEGDVSINYNEDGNLLTICIQNEEKSILKDVPIPFKCSKDYTSIEINNGIIILKVRRSE